MKNLYKIGENISITSNEEIKEGDWTVWKNQIFKVNSNNAYSYTNNVTLKYTIKYLKKIILTTDQDLVKDDVQEIDDEFLEWFVKNPNCEYVEVKKFFGFAEDYLIIIPQEEPKQLTTEEITELVFSKKQETLEEASLDFSKKFLNNGENSEFEAQSAYLGFIDGANWQQKRSYSEEFEAEIGTPPEYPIEGFRAATKIFMSALVDKMWEEHERLEIPMNLRKKEVEMLGLHFYDLIKKHTGIDTYEIYADNNE